jgi:hypothetical protein
VRAEELVLFAGEEERRHLPEENVGARGGREAFMEASTVGVDREETAQGGHG